MGTVVQFRPRKADVAAKTEAILQRIGKLYQQQARAREQLPGALAELLRHGHKDLVLEAVRLWGSGTMEAHQVLGWCQEAAAVAGVKSLGTQPLEPLQ